MISTPTMCHQAETLERMLTSFTPNVFSSPWMTMSTTNVRNVPRAVGVMPHTSAANAFMVVAAPKSMAAVTATSPRKLNHPTNQAQAALLRLASAAAHQ